MSWHDHRGHVAQKEEAVRIENWYFAKGFYPIDPNVNLGGRLHGTVYGHQNHHDGKDVMTSKLVTVRDGKVVTFSGNLYELGEPHPGYEAAFPNARARMLQQEPETRAYFGGRGAGGKAVQA